MLVVGQNWTGLIRLIHNEDDCYLQSELICWKAVLLIGTSIPDIFLLGATTVVFEPHFTSTRT